MGESYSGIRELADFIRDVAKYQQAVRRPTDSAEAVSDRLHWCHPTGLTGALRRKGPTATNGSMDLVGYIYMPSPGHFKVAGVATILIHTQETLQVYPSAY